jgi:hypothetical protein
MAWLCPELCPQRGKGHAVYRGWAKLGQSGLMHGCAIALVTREAIARIALVEQAHQAVTGDLGHD